MTMPRSVTAAAVCSLETLTSRDDPETIDALWLDAGPMRWSGFDEQANLQLLADAGPRVVEHEVLRQVEPEGCEIAPMWFVATR